MPSVICPAFFYLDGRRGSVGPVQNDVGLVFDDPLDDFGFVELHGLGESGREVDVPLLALLAFDELDFGRESHVGLLGVI